MAGSFTAEAGAALVFLILYVFLWSYMTFMYARKRYEWKSRYSILYLHTTIRVASQACGLAFAILAWRNIDVFVAYLILSAEGYFSLTIAAYYFLKHYEIKHFGWSRLGPADHNEGGRKRFLQALSMVAVLMPWRFWDRNLLMIVDAWLIPANAIIIAGGSIMAGLNDKSKQLDPDDYNNRLNVSKGLRTAGQAVFLALTVLFILLYINAARKGRGLKHSSERTMSKTALAIFGVVGGMLLVRGIFGVLQAAVYSLSYSNPENYDGHGMKSRFTAIEYCLAVVPEFTAAFLLNMSYWSTAREPSVELIDPEDNATEFVRTNRGGHETEYAAEDKNSKYETVPKYTP
ncbi:hypothetical protein A1Q2_03634 [Trichosporon asahii var. asahii CBS 8904]|uniref:Uncharacterized protein n=1 Tax=Trichosporon asahii var. asahii (strain CBS 8904) TaxID=1220162 RepID=K1VRH7_TRIAC|nr:hypothetical protein A1Q2_03634 [Trichosporon asahii var. asahii CBS 8904]